METLSLSVVEGVDSRATATILDDSKSSRMQSSKKEQSAKDNSELDDFNDIEIRDEDFNARFERSMSKGAGLTAEDRNWAAFREIKAEVIQKDKERKATALA